MRTRLRPTLEGTRASVTGKGKGTRACDGPTSASTGRPQCLPRPPSFRSPSRCPRPARRSPGTRTSSCSHTCGICPELLPESELPPARRIRTSGAGPRPGRPEKPRPPPRRQPALRRLRETSRTLENQANVWVALCSCCKLPGRNYESGQITAYSTVTEPSQKNQIQTDFLLKMCIFRILMLTLFKQS